MKINELMKMSDLRLGKKKRILLIAVLAVLIPVTVVWTVMYADVNGRGITVAEASKLLMYAMCDEELISTEAKEGYWYEDYVRFTKDKGYFDKKSPMDKVTYSDVRYIVKQLGVSDDRMNVKLMRMGIVPKEKFIDIYMEMLSMFEYGTQIETVLATVAGTPSNLEGIGEWRAYTSEGNYGFAGIILDDKIDKQVRFIVSNDEILTVVAVESEDVVYRNIWVKYSTDKKIYANIYGVDREFDINGLGENVTQVLSDIRLSKGKVKSVDIKSDKISGKVLSVTKHYVELEGYGKVDLDDYFMIYDVSDDFQVKDYKDIVVGYSLQDFVVAEGKICGAVILNDIDVDNIRVLVKSTGHKSIFHCKAAISSDTAFVVKAGEKENTYQAGEIIELDMSSELFKEGRITIKPLEDNTGEIKVLSVNRGQGNPSYEGDIELALFDDGIVIVNDIEVEKYLKRVVPSEMPASFGTECLKVQAVCARSYAYKQLKNTHYSAYGAHVDDSTQYQVYNNTIEYEASNKAIEQTKGLVLTYDDQIVQAYYYSTSCGVGTNVALWGSDISSYPYFVSRDIGTQNRNLNLTDESVFETFITTRYETDYDCELPMYRWNMTESISDISKCFNSKLSTWYSKLPDRVLTLQTDGTYKSVPVSSVGIIQDISVCKRVSGGAAVSVVVTGSERTVMLNSESLIRNMFGNAEAVLNTNKDTRSTDMLPSAFCCFKKNLDSSGQPVSFTIYGGGYGHGIGMSQNAVKGMVGSGMKFDEVLLFFYPGTSLSA